MSKGLEALKVWNAVEKYLNLYHHQAIKDDIDVETVEGMPIKIIEKSLKALEIILKVINIEKEDLYYDDETGYMFLGGKITKQEYYLLKEWLEK